MMGLHCLPPPPTRTHTHPPAPPATPCPQVLRLEPHVVVSNRTEVPLQLLQCRPALVAGAGSLAAASGGSGSWRAAQGGGAAAASSSGREGSISGKLGGQLSQLMKAPSRVLSATSAAAHRGATAAAAAAAGGVLVPEGGASFTHATRGVNALPLAAGLSRLVRPSPAGSSRQLLSSWSAPILGTRQQQLQQQGGGRRR